MSHTLSQQAFFNSLLAEIQDRHIDQDNAYIKLSDDKQIQLKLSYISPSWRHRYQGDISLQESGKTTQIEFAQAIDLIITHLYPSISAQQAERFKRRVIDSGNYIQRADNALAKRQSNSQDQFIEFEQNLSAGHNMHPAAKSCDPLHEAEQQQYLPEFAGSFALQWFAVHRSHLIGECVSGEIADQLAELYANLQCQSVTSNNTQSNILLDPDWVPLPMHPLQANAWRESEHALTLSEVVKDLECQSPGWTATSSSRAIYHPQSSWMLKISLPVKLTNSLRLLSSAETQRGVQFSELLNSEAGQEMQQRLNHSYFIEEPAWCSILDNQGQVLDLPIVSFRENPFFSEMEQASKLDASQVYCLASANQITPQQPQSQLVSWINHYAQEAQLSFHDAALHWLDKFWDKVIAPICIARADYGIVLLAHQQNILLKIHNNLPVGAAYRDCQGIGLTDQALQTFKTVLQEQGAHYYMAAQEVNPYHAYYVIANSLFSSIANIAATGLISEQAMWRLSRDKITALNAAHPQDNSFYQYLLTSPSLRWKRNFYCFLADHNEATLADPSQIYCDITNPLQATEQLQLTHKILASGRQICIAENELSAQGVIGFSIREYGQTVATGSLTKIGQQVHLTFSTITKQEDTELWWSAAEHAFYRCDVEKLSAAAFPSSVQPLVDQTSDSRLHRVDFLQNATLWRVAQTPLENEQRLVAENGIEHPQRPSKPTGIVYNRYLYHLKRQITFRVIDKERDIHCFNRWHNHPIISPIWELEGDIASHQAYLQKQKQDAHQYAVIGEFDGVPFGYFEVYWTPEDRLGPHYQCQDHDRGVHILVGNFTFRAGVYFDAWAKSILHYCFLDEPRTENIFGEPNAKNDRVVKITERVGLQKQFEFDFPHKRAALLKCEKPRFFTQFAI